jgi:hypothetical protein
VARIICLIQVNPICNLKYLPHNILISKELSQWTESFPRSLKGSFFPRVSFCAYLLYNSLIIPTSNHCFISKKLSFSTPDLKHASDVAPTNFPRHSQRKNPLISVNTPQAAWTTLHPQTSPRSSFHPPTSRSFGNSISNSVPQRTPAVDWRLFHYNSCVFTPTLLKKL